MRYLGRHSPRVNIYATDDGRLVCTDSSPGQHGGDFSWQPSKVELLDILFKELDAIEMLIREVDSVA